jgi:transposase
MIRLTDEQWERIRDHFPEENIADGRPGRKPIPTRCVLEAVLWILNTGAQWHMLPQSYISDRRKQRAAPRARSAAAPRRPHAWQGLPPSKPSKPVSRMVLKVLRVQVTR